MHRGGGCRRRRPGLGGERRGRPRQRGVPVGEGAAHLVEGRRDVAAFVAELAFCGLDEVDGGRDECVAVLSSRGRGKQQEGGERDQTGGES